MEHGLKKRTAKLYWMVKGHIPDWLHKCSQEELKSIEDQYTQRLWGNEEIYLREEGFYEAWEVFND